MKASEVIREAKNLLFERGWCQGDLMGPDGLCTRGALGVAATGSAYASNFASVEAEFFIKTVVYPVTVPGWNDAPGSTFGEVIDALDRAEKLALQHEEAE